MRDVLQGKLSSYINTDEQYIADKNHEEYILENNFASVRDVGSCPRLLTEIIRCEQDALEQNTKLCTDDDADDDDDDDDNILDSEPQMFGPRRASYFCA